MNNLDNQIRTLETDRNRLINEVTRTSSREQRTLLNRQISEISAQINELIKEKEKKKPTAKNIENILKRNSDVLDKRKRMVITVKPHFTTNQFIIYYLKKTNGILDITKKQVNKLTTTNKTTWVGLYTETTPVLDSGNRDFVDRNRLTAQTIFFNTYIYDVQIQSICILNENDNFRLVFDIDEVAGVIQNFYHDVVRKNVVQREYAPERLFKQGYFNDLNDTEDPVDMVGKGRDSYRRQFELQEAMSKPGFDPEQFEIDYTEKIRSMGTLFGRTRKTQNALKTVYSEMKYLQKIILN